MKNITKIANLLSAIENCRKSGNKEWYANHSDSLDSIIKDGPSGSGIDCGTKLDESSTKDKVVLICEFHHMNENGMYDGWTEHKIIVTASLQNSFDLRITGRDRNQIKEYLHEVYAGWLHEEFVS